MRRIRAKNSWTREERFLSSQADPFAGSEWGRKNRPASVGMTAGGGAEVEIRRRGAETRSGDVKIRTLEKLTGAAPRRGRIGKKKRIPRGLGMTFESPSWELGMVFESLGSA
jgi:hypothetical protein